jgi:hypothetical protein
MGQVKNALLEIEGLVAGCLNDKMTMEETVEYCSNLFSTSKNDNYYLNNKNLIRKIYTNFVYEEAVNL